jgi:hypothetical protein
MKKIAVITSVRNDTVFTDRWIGYYSEQFGSNNLYVQLDGLDQPLPDPSYGVNVIRHEFIRRNVVAGEKFRAARASELAAKLFADGYDLVIGTDIDEFLLVDPKLKESLKAYLSRKRIKNSLSGLGVDVVQNTAVEPALDASRPFLDQRSYALLSHRYTKPCILSKPLRWGSGYHRVKGHNFRIDPNLFMFHFGSVDRSVSSARLSDKDRIEQGWTTHQIRREKMFEDVMQLKPLDGDERFASARRSMTWIRPVFAINKPGPLRANGLILIPARFRGLV